MGKKRLSNLEGMDLWAKKPASLTAAQHLDTVLGSVRNLPLRYWRSGFYFVRADDEKLLKLTSGHFPKKLVPRKSHPIYTLHQLPDQTGFKVCPCSSKRPFNKSRFRYIKKGCRLMHTHDQMDRDSFVIEAVKFNVPPSMAYRLLFKGEVPAECLQSGGSK